MQGIAYIPTKRMIANGCTKAVGKQDFDLIMNCTGWHWFLWEPEMMLSDFSSTSVLD